MFKDEYDAAAKAAAAKANKLNSDPLGYFVLSMLAGIFIGFGILLVYTLSGSLDGSPFTKLVMASAFAVALSLVVIGGAELFTGNNMVMAAGFLKRTVPASDVLKLWAVCWLGNLAGAILLSVIYSATGLLSGATLDAVMQGAAAKLEPGPMALFARGMLCNMLVCMAVWSCIRAKSDAGKLIMIFWCILAFFATGFEHSIANMTLFTLYAMSAPDTLAAAGASLVQVLIVTAGNMAGGILLVAVPYYLAQKD